MAKYDLTGSLESKFTFSIEDKEFEFKKPTVREMRALAKKFTEIDKIEDTDKQMKASDEAMQDLYSFIVPINHTTSVEDAMQDQPVDVQAAFNDMVKKELLKQ